MIEKSVESLEKLIDDAQKKLALNGSLLSKEQKDQLVLNIRTAQLELAELNKSKSSIIYKKN